jgi:hypothetical protein
LRPAFDLIETIRPMTGRQDAFKAVRRRRRTNRPAAGKPFDEIERKARLANDPPKTFDAVERRGWRPRAAEP